MIRTRFEIVTSIGERFVGPVQGSGGEIDGMAGLKRLLSERDRAAKGIPLRSMYEPRPGHVSVKVGACALSDGRPVAVPLVGSTFVLLGEAESDSIARELQRAARGYAQKYVNDDGDPECTDEEIARVLANCALKPRPELYPSIRTAVYDLVTEGGRRKS